MATHALPASHILDDEDAPAATVAPKRPSFMRRFYAALIVTQSRRARREIDRILGPGAYERALRGELPRRF